MAASNSIVVNTVLNTAGFNSGIRNMRNSVTNLTGLVAKLGAAFGVTFGVGFLVRTGKEAIELGSDLQEVQNVVDVTFGAMSKDINEFAQNAIEQFGLSEKSAKQYASTMGAMLKSMGIDTATALSMSKELTGLAGDIASFYNLTSDEAFAKIRSGISGETEPLKQLGINLSVANLEAFALAEGITKSYNAMTEQEKAMLRYNYLLKATADAQGDFARTSDGWANQTRILTEQFNSLKATIGQGLINALTPVLGVLNKIIARLQIIANAFKAWTESVFGAQSIESGTDEAADSLESVADGYSDVAESAAAATKEQQKNLSSLEELNVLNSESKNGGAGGISGGGTLFDLNNVEDGSEQLEDARDVVADLEKRFPKLTAFITEAGKKLKEIAFDLSEGNFFELGQDVSGLAVMFYDFISEAIADVDWKDIGNKIGEFLSGVDWFEVVRSALSLKSNIWHAIGDLWFGSFEAAPVETAIITAIAGLKFVGLGSAISSAITAALVGWNLGQILYEGMTGDEIEMTFLEQMSAIKDSFIDGSWFDALLLWRQDVDDGLQAMASDLWDWVIGLGEDVRGLYKEIFKGILNSTISLINSTSAAVVAFINGLIDKINKIGFEVPEWVPGIGGEDFGFNIPKLSPINIPMLATGAVIPPNAPFMAMLGDQKNGTNLETPEGLLRQIIREETANGSGGDIVIQIDGREVFRVTQKHANEYYQRTGNPAYPI